MKSRKNLSRIKTKKIQLRVILALMRRAFQLILTEKSKMETKKINPKRHHLSHLRANRTRK